MWKGCKDLYTQHLMWKSEIRWFGGTFAIRVRNVVVLNTLSLTTLWTKSNIKMLLFSFGWVRLYSLSVRSWIRKRKRDRRGEETGRLGGKKREAESGKEREIKSSILGKRGKRLLISARHGAQFLTVTSTKGDQDRTKRKRRMYRLPPSSPGQ